MFPGTNEEITSELQRLALNAVRLTENGDVAVSVGGILDNEVGFYFVKNEKPPQIDDEPGENYIWVEPLGGGWFLFRTT